MPEVKFDQIGDRNEYDFCGRIASYKAYRGLSRLIGAYRGLSVESGRIAWNFLIDSRNVRQHTFPEFFYTHLVFTLL